MPSPPLPLSSEWEAYKPTEVSPLTTHVPPPNTHVLQSPYPPSSTFLLSTQMDPTANNPQGPLNTNNNPPNHPGSPAAQGRPVGHLPYLKTTSPVLTLTSIRPHRRSSKTNMPL
ncbi:hypothetical protein NLI96_g5430 [Meripilus lineatus]|uniref:Uncharacterized protein n=1 Tax=Meripilus lineatus TaxID=2056292 RepID=A0AAD5V317_9APHY|nr:hypothetical protein NLI96_g5430 [Physisporinus lineatus]